MVLSNIMISILYIYLDLSWFKFCLACLGFPKHQTEDFKRVRKKTYKMLKIDVCFYKRQSNCHQEKCNMFVSLGEPPLSEPITRCLAVWYSCRFFIWHFIMSCTLHLYHNTYKWWYGTTLIYLKACAACWGWFIIISLVYHD